MSSVLPARVAPPEFRAAIVHHWPILVGLAALYLPTWFDLARGPWQTEDNAHGPIILAVAGFLAWRRRASLAAAAPEPKLLAGAVALALGLALYVLGRSQDLALFEVGSQIPVLAGVLLLTIGWRGLGAMWFPLLFLSFMVPLPGTLIDALTGPLKQTVSYVAEVLLYHAGYPVARSGVVLVVGQYQLLVADACSGLNSMFSLAALGLLYAYIVRGDRWWHTALLVASILPIAFAANIVRVIALVLITFHFGDRAGQGFLHGFAGLLLFMVALVLLIVWDGLLRLASRPRTRSGAAA